MTEIPRPSDFKSPGYMRFDPASGRFFVRYVGPTHLINAYPCRSGRMWFEWKEDRWYGDAHHVGYFVMLSSKEAHFTVEAKAEFDKRKTADDDNRMAHPFAAVIVADRTEADCVAEEALWLLSKAESDKRIREREEAERRERLAPLDGATPAHIAAAYEAVQLVCSFDADRAKARNGWGFSQADTKAGHRLAKRRPANRKPEDDADALRLAWRYRGQLPDGLHERVRDVTNMSAAKIDPMTPPPYEGTIRRSDGTAPLNGYLEPTEVWKASGYEGLQGLTDFYRIQILQLADGRWARDGFAHEIELGNGVYTTREAAIRGSAAVLMKRFRADRCRIRSGAVDLYEPALKAEGSQKQLLRWINTIVDREAPKRTYLHNQIKKYERGIAKAEAWLKQQEAAGAPENPDAVAYGRAKIAEMEEVLGTLRSQRQLEQAPGKHAVGEMLVAAGIVPSVDHLRMYGIQAVKGASPAPSRMYTFPVKYVPAVNSEHDQIYILDEALRSLPRVREIAAIVGDRLEVWHPGLPTSFGTEHGRWHHAVYFMTDEHFGHLLESRHLTTDTAIERVVVVVALNGGGISGSKKGGISTKNARKVLSGIGVEEPSDRSVSVLLDRKRMQISSGSGGPCINAHGDGCAWAYIHGLEDGWLVRRRDGFVSPETKMIDGQSKITSAEQEKPNKLISDPLAPKRVVTEPLGVFEPASEWLDRRQPPTFGATYDEREAAAIIAMAMKECHPDDAPQPYRRIIAAKVYKRDFFSSIAVEAELELLDGRTARFECWKLKDAPDSWHIDWPDESWRGVADERVVAA